MWPEIVGANVGDDAFRFLNPKGTTCDHYTMVVLTPLLTPLSTQYAETPGNHQQRKRLR